MNVNQVQRDPFTLIKSDHAEQRCRDEGYTC